MKFTELTKFTSFLDYRVRLYIQPPPPPPCCSYFIYITHVIVRFYGTQPNAQLLLTLKQCWRSGLNNKYMLECYIPEKIKSIDCFLS